MKALLAVALTVVLVVPAVAIADRGSSDGRARVSSHASKKLTKTLKKQRQAAIRSTRARSRQHSGDEREVTGRIVSLSPLQVGTLTCQLRAGTSLQGFAIGDRVELTCDLVGGQWLLRKLEHEDDEDDEREVKGRIASLAPLTVGTLTCRVPTGVSLAGFAVGDLVEMKCDRVAAEWVLRKLQHEDDDDRAGSGDADDDDDDHDDDDDDDDDEDDDDSGSDSDDD